MEKLQCELFNVFNEIQKNVSCHQRYIKDLIRLYKKYEFDVFTTSFLHCLKLLFTVDLKKNVFIENCLEFACSFVVSLEHQLQVQYSLESELSAPPPFLRVVIEQILKFHKEQNFKNRYHCCNFFRILLNSSRDYEILDDDVCIEIQDAMLERLMDCKLIVRMKAITSLVRLQNPGDESCPIIRAYLLCLRDPCPQIRKSIVENVAPSALTLHRIVDCVGDVNLTVRTAALKRCSFVHPDYLNTVERQRVCFAGFQEQNTAVKKVFINVLLVKWLSAYDGNFMKFIEAIKLDKDEDDIQASTYLAKSIMEQFFKMYPFKNIIDHLALDDNKLLATDKISSEIILYWNIVHGYSTSNDLDEIVDTIVPELSLFCDFVESVILEKDDIELQTREHLEHQFILSNLFDMAGRFDLTDEVGRRRLHQLVSNTILKRKLEVSVITPLMVILEKLNNNIHNLIEEVCELIANIKDSKIKLDLTDLELRHHNSQLSKLHANMNNISANVDTAIKQQDYTLATDLEGELAKLVVKESQMQKKLIMPEQLSNEDLRIYRCLDLLISLLLLEKVDRLNETLRDFRDDFVSGLHYSNNILIYGRIYRCCILSALIDEESAKNYLKIIFTPIILYDYDDDYDKDILLMAIKVVPDLIYIYGPNLFTESLDKEEIEHTENFFSQYFKVDKNTAPDKLNAVTQLFDTLMTILEDESLEVRECAGMALCCIIYHGILVSSSLLTQILIKWHNPETEKQLPKTYRLIGVSIMHFAHSISGSEDIIGDTIIPIINMFSNISRTSLLAGANIDSVINVLGILIKVKENDKASEMQKKILHELSTTILQYMNYKCVALWIKMLLAVTLPIEDKSFLRELQSKIEIIYKGITEKPYKLKLKKYLKLINYKLGNDHENNRSQSSSIDDKCDANKVCDKSIKSKIATVPRNLDVCNEHLNSSMSIFDSDDENGNLNPIRTDCVDVHLDDADKINNTFFNATSPLNHCNDNQNIKKHDDCCDESIGVSPMNSDNSNKTSEGAYNRDFSNKRCKCGIQSNTFDDGDSEKMMTQLARKKSKPPVVVDDNANIRSDNDGDQLNVIGQHKSDKVLIVAVKRMRIHDVTGNILYNDIRSNSEKFDDVDTVSSKSEEIPKLSRKRFRPFSEGSTNDEIQKRIRICSSDQDLSNSS